MVIGMVWFASIFDTLTISVRSELIYYALEGSGGSELV
jgi:hypothetical protein